MIHSKSWWRSQSSLVAVSGPKSQSRDISIEQQVTHNGKILPLYMLVVNGRESKRSTTNLHLCQSFPFERLSSLTSLPSLSCAHSLSFSLNQKLSPPFIFPSDPISLAYYPAGQYGSVYFRHPSLHLRQVHSSHIPVSLSLPSPMVISKLPLLF